jgi:hypothetical protein
MFMCSVSERYATRHSALCMCGVRYDGKRGRYSCGINQNRNIAEPSRIVPLLDGKVGRPLDEPSPQPHREQTTPSLSGFGWSKDTASGALRTRRRPDTYPPRIIEPPPVVVDVVRSADQPVRCWLPRNAKAWQTTYARRYSTAKREHEAAGVPDIRGGLHLDG